MDVNPVDLLVGSAIMPPVIALLNQRQWPAPAKGIIALAACLVASVVVELVRGPLAITGWRDTAIVVAGSSFAAYKLYWQPSGIAPKLEAATSPAPAVDDTDWQPIDDGQHRIQA